MLNKESRPSGAVLSPQGCAPPVQAPVAAGNIAAPTTPPAAATVLVDAFAVALCLSKAKMKDFNPPRSQVLKAGMGAVVLLWPILATEMYVISAG